MFVVPGQKKRSAPVWKTNMAKVLTACRQRTKTCDPGPVLVRNYTVIIIVSYQGC